MKFSEALRSLPGDFFNFRGVATRSEYNWKILIFWASWALSLFLVAILDLLLTFQGSMTPSGSSAITPFQIIYVVGAWLPILWALFYYFPQSVRRGRDAGFPWWGVLIVTFVGLLPFLLLALMFCSTKQDASQVND